MGFLGNLAGKTEIKSRQAALEAFESLGSSVRLGDLVMPCHIIDEKHNGFSASKGEAILGVYRCQGFWWGKELTELDLDELLRSETERVYAELDYQFAIQIAPFPGQGALAAAAAIDQLLDRL